MNVITQLAEEAYRSREGIEVSAEEWMALYIGEFAHLIIHEAASVANAAIIEAGGDGDAIFKKIVDHFEEFKDENTEEELPED
jgi:hypothetical protein